MNSKDTRQDFSGTACYGHDSVARSWYYLLWAIKLILARSAHNLVGAKRPNNGVYRLPLIFECVRLSYSCFCVTDCESCTLPNSTTPISAEASHVELARGTSLVASHLELRSRLLWYWCVSSAAGSCVVSVFFFRAHKAYMPHVSGNLASCIIYTTAAALAYNEALGATCTCTQQRCCALSLSYFTLLA